MSRGVVAVCDGDIWETRDSWIAGCNDRYVILICDFGEAQN